MKKFILLITFIPFVEGMEFNAIPKLFDLISLSLQKRILSKNISTSRTILLDYITHYGFHPIIRGFLLRHPNETFKSTTKKLILAFFLALYFQETQINKHKEEPLINPISRFIIETIYQHPYLCWTKINLDRLETPEDDLETLEYNSLNCQTTVAAVLTAVFLTNKTAEAVLAKMINPLDKLLWGLRYAERQCSSIVEVSKPGYFESLLDRYGERTDFSLVYENGETLLIKIIGQFKETIVLAFLIALTENDVTKSYYEKVFNKADFEGLTPLHHTLARGYVEASQFFLQHNASAKSITKDGKMTLHFAAKHKSNLELMNTLLESSVDPNQQDNLRQSPLMEAAKYRNNESMVHLLLAYNADIDLKDRFGDAALHYAARSGAFKTTMILLEHKAILWENNKGNTPLPIAAAHGNYKTLSLLVDHVTGNLDDYWRKAYARIEANMANTRQETPLIKAVQGMPHTKTKRRRQLETVKKLLAYRANPIQKDIDGSSALDYAINNPVKQKRIVQLLVQAAGVKTWGRTLIFNTHSNACSSS